MNALVALRLWAGRWRSTRACISVHAGSAVILSLLLRMRTSSPPLCLITREVALDVAEACYRPDFCVHTSGAANVATDMLSRRFQPGKQWQLPALLRTVPEAFPPERTDKFYRTLSPTVSPLAARQAAVEGASGQVFQ